MAICPACQFDAGDVPRFCPSCGHTLPTAPEATVTPEEPPPQIHRTSAPALTRTSSFSELPLQVQEEIREAARAKGVRVQNLPSEKVESQLSAGIAKFKLRFPGGGLDAELPAPSQSEIDRWFRKNGRAMGFGVLGLGALALFGPRLAKKLKGD